MMGRQHDHRHDDEHAHAPSQQIAADDAPTRESFRIRGMDCAEEVAVLKRELGPLVGGAQHLGFDVLQGRMIIRESAAATPTKQIMDAVARTGMTAQLWNPEQQRVPPQFNAHGRTLRSPQAACAPPTNRLTRVGFRAGIE